MAHPKHWIINEGRKERGLRINQPLGKYELWLLFWQRLVANKDAISLSQACSGPSLPLSTGTGKKQARGDSTEKTRVLGIFQVRKKQAWLTGYLLEKKWITIMNTKHSQSPMMHRMHSSESGGRENSCVWSYLHHLGSFPRREYDRKVQLKPTL